MATTSPLKGRSAAVIAAAVMMCALSPAAAQRGPSASQRITALLYTVTHGMRAPSFDFDFSDTARRHLPDPSRRAWESDASRWAWVAQQVRSIPTAALSTEERLTVQLLAWEARANRQKAPFWWVDFSTITPYSSPLGGIARGFSARPLRLSSDTTVYLQLLREVAPMIDSIRTGLELRAARGIRLSKQALPARVAEVAQIEGEMAAIRSAAG